VVLALSRVLVIGLFPKESSKRELQEHKQDGQFNLFVAATS